MLELSAIKFEGRPKYELIKSDWMLKKILII